MQVIFQQLYYILLELLCFYQTELQLKTNNVEDVAQILALLVNLMKDYKTNSQKNLFQVIKSVQT